MSLKRQREEGVCIEKADCISLSSHMPDYVTAKCPRDGGMEEGSKRRGGGGEPE